MWTTWARVWVRGIMGIDVIVFGEVLAMKIIQNYKRNCMVVRWINKKERKF